MVSQPLGIRGVKGREMVRARETRPDFSEVERGLPGFQQHPHGSKCSAVGGRRPQLSQSALMLSRAVAFVARKPIAWILFVQGQHQPVACYLRNNGGGGNRQAARVAFNQRKLRQAHRWELERVY